MLNKILSVYIKYFALWVLILAAVAYFFPGPFVAMGDYDAAFFALTMFGIGAVLSIGDFKGIAKQPIIVLIGSAAQFTIMPIGAFLLAKAFGLPSVIAIGLVLAGSAPGAMASEVLNI